MFDIHDKANYTRDSIEFIILYTLETNYSLYCKLQNKSKLLLVFFIPKLKNIVAAPQHTTWKNSNFGQNRAQIAEGTY